MSGRSQRLVVRYSEEGEHRAAGHGSPRTTEVQPWLPSQAHHGLNWVAQEPRDTREGLFTFCPIPMSHNALLPDMTPLLSVLWGHSNSSCWWEGSLAMTSSPFCFFLTNEEMKTP